MTVSDNFDRADGSSPGAGWTPLPRKWGIPEAPIDGSGTLTTTVEVVPADGGILTPWGRLTYPPGAQVGDVVRWTVRGGEVSVEINPSEDNPDA